MQLIVDLHETTGRSSSFFPFFLIYIWFKPELTQGPGAITWLQSERCVTLANPFELLSWRFYSVEVVQLAWREFSRVCFWSELVDSLETDFIFKSRL